MNVWGSQRRSGPRRGGSLAAAAAGGAANVQGEGGGAAAPVAAPQPDQRTRNQRWTIGAHQAIYGSVKIRSLCKNG